MKSFLPITLAGALGLFSCQTDFVDPTDINIVAEPALAFPLGSVNLTMEHLLSPDDSLIYNDNATYKVVVAQDSVFGINVNDLISFPAQSPSSSAISMGTIAVDNVTISQSIALGAIASDAGLTSITAAHGSNAPFPSMNESNVGTYGGSGFSQYCYRKYNRIIFFIKRQCQWRNGNRYRISSEQDTAE